MSNNFFVLISHSRSGGVSLQRLLEEVPSIYFEPEILSNMSDPQQYVETFIDLHCNLEVQASGFMCNIFDYENYIKEHVIQNADFKKIIIYRKNLVDAFISEQFSKYINKWHYFNEDVLPREPKEKISIDYDSISFNINMTRKKLDECVRLSNGDSLIIEKDDLFYSEESLDRIYNLLDIPHRDRKYEFPTTFSTLDGINPIDYKKYILEIPEN